MTAENQQDVLLDVLQELMRARANIAANVQIYDLPDGYEAILALMDNQEQAIRNLLEGRELGCELGSLAVDLPSMLHAPHLKNCAHVAAQAKMMSEDDGSEFFNRLNGVLHNMKGRDVAVALSAYQEISHSLGVTTFRKAPNGPDSAPRR